MLGFAKALRGFLVVFETDHGVHVADIQVIVMEGETKRASEIVSKDFALLHATGVLRVAKDIDLSSAGLREKDVAIWRREQQAGAAESRSKDVNVKAGGHPGEKAVRRFDAARAITSRFGGERSGQYRFIAEGDLSAGWLGGEKKDVQRQGGKCTQ